MSKYKFEIKATEHNNSLKLKNSVEKFKNEVILMSLTRSQTNQIFVLLEEVIDTYSHVVKAVVPAAEKKTIEDIKAFDQAAKQIIECHKSDYKRRKNIGENAAYVEPEEKAIGYKWVQNVDETGNIIRHYQQNTFQFIRPSKTIHALFSNPDFAKIYRDSVENKAHECQSGVYKDYCCGSHYRRNQFLSENPNALQLQLYTDDFEPCDALKSKAGRHKKCAFYLVIRNLPKKLQSKLSNIFLVAIAGSSDIKNDSGGIKSILEVIIDDLKMLSTVGISVNGTIVKGCLICMSFDNLGGNACYGLVQSFKANFFCRFCECHQNVCKKLAKEDSSKLRDIDSYNEMCLRILAESNLDPTETKGIREYCKLNDLPSFHIFQNYTVDPLHDLLEGAVPFALHIIFDHCLEKKLFNLNELQNRIQFYNYGPLNKRNIPSKLRMMAKNLGQNATQLHCLMLNIPFILHQYKNHLEEISILIETLLQILEIVFSEKISENDLICLESTVERHAKFIIDTLKKDLIPKHHILTHYPRVIQSMGPAVFTNTMRLEAKHQELKATALKTNNFQNLNKTIAEKHQMLLALRENRFCDEIVPGQVISPFDYSEEYDVFNSDNQLTLQGNEFLIQSLKVNGFVYKPGLLLIFESIFF